MFRVFAIHTFGSTHQHNGLAETDLVSRYASLPAYVQSFNTKTHMLLERTALMLEALSFLAVTIDLYGEERLHALSERLRSNIAPLFDLFEREGYSLVARY